MEQAIESLLPSLATADLAARRYRTIPRLSRLRRRAMAPVKSNKKPCGASNHSPAKDCMILALVSGLNSAFSGLARCGRRFRCSFHLQLLPYNFPPPPCTYTPTLETENRGMGSESSCTLLGLPSGHTVRPSNQEYLGNLHQGGDRHQ